MTSKTLTGIKISHVVSLQLASLARSTLSALVAGRVTLAKLHQYKLRMFSSCCVVVHKLGV